MPQSPEYIPTNPAVTVALSPVVKEHPSSIGWDESDLDEQEYLDRLKQWDRQLEASQNVS